MRHCLKPFDYTREFFTSVYAWVRLIRKWARQGIAVPLPDGTLEFWQTCERNCPYDLGRIWDLAEAIRK